MLMSFLFIDPKAAQAIRIRSASLKLAWRRYLNTHYGDYLKDPEAKISYAHLKAQLEDEGWLVIDESTLDLYTLQRKQTNISKQRR